MSNFSSSSAFEKKTLVGLWWIPKQEKKCYGTLYFDLAGEQKLYLLGCFEDHSTFSLPKYEVIHGICEVEKKQKAITIFHAWVTNMSPQLNDTINISETPISFEDVWIGECLFNSIEDVCFSSFYFGLNNLEKWQDERGTFFANYDRKQKKVMAEMNIPDPILLFSDKNVHIFIDYSIQLPGFCLGQTESIMRYKPQIKIVPKSKSLRYYGNKDSFSFYISLVFQLFELFMFGYTFPFYLHGGNPVQHDNNSQGESFSEILYSRDVTLKQRKSIQPQEILFPLKKIQEHLLLLSKNFQDFFIPMGNILEVLCSSLCTRSYNIYSLPIMIFSLEGLQKLFYRNIKKTNFRNRLYEILQDVSPIFRFLDEKLNKKIAKDLKGIRNATAHFDPQELSDFNVHMFVRKITFVQFLHIAIIMKSCGLPPDIIRECFEKVYPSEYHFMERDIKDYYASMPEDENE